MISRTIAALALAAGLLGASSAVSADAEPYCPTEDSCTADYRDGGWVIEEVTP